MRTLRGKEKGGRQEFLMEAGRHTDFCFLVPDWTGMMLKVIHVFYMKPLPSPWMMKNT